MAKHPVPKRKTSKARTSTRHSSWRNKLAKFWSDKAQVVECKNCNKNQLAHQVCPHCGHYKGREVVNMKKGDDNIKVIQA